MQVVANSINDPMLRYNCASLTANAAEKVKILAENGQIPLAYMTAKAQGLEEFAKTLENNPNVQLEAGYHFCKGFYFK